VEDANFENRGELLLVHRFEGVEMQPDYMQETLKNLEFVWRRPVHLVTASDGKPILVTCDKGELKEQTIESPGAPLPQGEGG
jgi:stage V sporulation protein R